MRWLMTWKNLQVNSKHWKRVASDRVARRARAPGGPIYTTILDITETGKDVEFIVINTSIVCAYVSHT